MAILKSTKDHLKSNDSREQNVYNIAQHAIVFFEIRLFSRLTYRSQQAFFTIETGSEMTNPPLQQTTNEKVFFCRKRNNKFNGTQTFPIC